MDVPSHVHRRDSRASPLHANGELRRRHAVQLQTVDEGGPHQRIVAVWTGIRLDRTDTEKDADIARIPFGLRQTAAEDATFKHRLEDELFVIEGDRLLGVGSRSSIASLYRVSHEPSLYVVARAGVVRLVHRGWHDGEASAVAAEANSLL